jgi:hypothetical protein
VSAVYYCDSSSSHSLIVKQKDPEEVILLRRKRIETGGENDADTIVNRGGRDRNVSLVFPLKK